MSPAAARERLLRIAYWTLPLVVAVRFHWLGLKTWFLADDFAWLNHATEFSNFSELIRAIFTPFAQGTIRPWSDRIFFMVFYRAFGLDPLPFHIWILLTQCANILLLLSIVRRITGSRLAGFAAALFWIVNTSQPLAMAWTSAYNEPLCALFILGAFHFLLRYLETGERRYWVLQWVVFLLGFGALELNVVYPALAATYTFLCARKHFLRTLPLFLASAVFAIVHRMLAPPAAAAYGMHFGWPMLQVLGTYWGWTLGPAFLASIIPLNPWLVTLPAVLLTLALVGPVAWRAWKGERLPLFLLAWFFLLIAPMLPLSDHLTEYYPFLASLGLAMLGGWGLSLAWRQARGWRLAAAALALLYLGFSVPASVRSIRWEYERGRRVRNVLLGVKRAHELHPGKVILLDHVDEGLFWVGILDHPFPLVRAEHVYLTPGTEEQIAPRPALGDPAAFVLPPGPTWYALVHDQAVVYDVRSEPIRGVTSLYTKKMPLEWELLKPARVDLANPAEAYLLGPEWHVIEGDHRWMPRRATLQLAGPRTEGGKLRLVGSAGPAATRLRAALDGTKLPERPLAPGEAFDFEWDVPAALAGKAAMRMEIETDRAVTMPGDDRDLGLVFGIVEIRE